MAGGEERVPCFDHLGAVARTRHEIHVALARDVERVALRAAQDTLTLLERAGADRAAEQIDGLAEHPGHRQYVMPTMSQLVFDEKLVAQLEELYATRDVLRRRRLIREALDVKPGERILDVGCGPGFYVAELLDEVGPNGSIVGLDGSATMLAVAAKRSEGKPNVAFLEADATALPVGDGEFDAALCVQVLEYVPDATAALRELHRPCGRAAGCSSGTSIGRPCRGIRPIQRAWSAMLEAWDAHLAHPSLPRTLGPRMRAAGFEEVEAEGHTFATAELTADAYGGAAIPVVEKYVAGHEAIGPDEAAAWAAEQRELGQRGEFYFACVQLCFTGTRPG